jgi:hypothetical protein
VTVLLLRGHILCSVARSHMAVVRVLAVLACATLLAPGALGEDCNSLDFLQTTMRDYPDVYHRMHALCGAQSDALFNRLNKPFSLDDYAAFFNIADYTLHSPSDLLLSYLEHYASQTTCASMVSAMLPCLCIYPTIEAKIRTDIGDTINTIDPLAKAWMDYNKSSGTSCKLAQCMRREFGFFV